MRETWKDIKSYETHYKVSNLGRIKSKARIIIDSLGRKNHHVEKILKPLFGSRGYPLIRLSKITNGISIGKTMTIHRIVAKTFIPNPSKYKEINHINEIKTDNRAENLEWCNRKYNIHFGNGLKKRINSQKKQIFQICPETGKIIKKWESAKDCEKSNFNASHIGKCCKGKYKTAYGFKWMYGNECK